MTTPGRPASLSRSQFVTAFAHLGEVYLYHDLFGYILQMSEDVLGLLDAFGEGGDTAAVCARFAGAFGEQPPESFVDIFVQFGCLVEPGENQLDDIWGMVPVKSPWNVWRRAEDGGLLIYTAWGERPLTSHRLSPAEAALFQLFDGETPLSPRLAAAHPEVDVPVLIQRLVHHDTQAVKLSAVPVSFF